MTPSTCGLGITGKLCYGYERRVVSLLQLRRLGTAYVDGVYDDGEYRRRKQMLDMELESLVVPKADATEEAGRLIENLPKLWAGASLEERQRLLLTMLEPSTLTPRRSGGSSP